MVPNNIDSDALVLAEDRQLDHQTLAEVPCGDTGRIEVLNNFQRILHVFERVLAAFGYLFQSNRNFSAVLVDSAEIAVFVQISDDGVAGQPDLVLHSSQS